LVQQKTDAFLSWGSERIGRVPQPERQVLSSKLFEAWETLSLYLSRQGSWPNPTKVFRKIEETGNKDPASLNRQAGNVIRVNSRSVEMARGRSISLPQEAILGKTHLGGYLVFKRRRSRDLRRDQLKNEAGEDPGNRVWRGESVS